mmetsp:Transcript_96793/g.273512  ORF Transcript_96793/g.273512 Transcript_96793/m.273512 type:complete len:797 (+) Transcript_96793:175-2565(+)
MGRKGPHSYAKRGISRSLAGDITDLVAQQVRASLGNVTSFQLSPAVRRTLSSVREIYEVRGFVSLQDDEFCEQLAAADGHTQLDWVDTRNSGKWVAAAFTASTSAGTWRIVVDSACRVTGAYPIVDERRRPSCERSKVASDDGHHKTAAAQKAQAQRLKSLGAGLREVRHELSRFLERWCPASHRQRLWSSCERFMWQFKDDLPQLCGALDWQDGETWAAWAKRISEDVCSACVTEERVVPVRCVRFTHSAISVRFLHGAAKGSDLETLVEDLRHGRVDPLVEEGLVLECVTYRGALHSLNNRRLWALQQHQLLLLCTDVEVCVRVRVLPWSDEETVLRFMKAFDTENEGVTVRCRTSQVGVPTDGVVATTLGRAVLATKASVEAEMRRERSVLEGREAGLDTSATVISELKDECSKDPQRPTDEGTLRLGDEVFGDWKDAKQRVQSILRQRSKGQPVSDNELRLLLDVFRLHPSARRKRIDDVVSVTVGSSEKFSGTPAFWIWRRDGSGEDISVNKCWKQFDSTAKAVKKNTSTRATLYWGLRFCGHLKEWNVATGKNYGFVTLENRKVPRVIEITGPLEGAVVAQDIIVKAIQDDASARKCEMAPIVVFVCLPSHVTLNSSYHSTLEEQTGAMVSLHDDSLDGSLWCRLTGSLEQISVAQRAIHARGLQQLKRGTSTDAVACDSASVVWQFSVTHAMMGAVLGRSGATLEEAKAHSGCRIEEPAWSKSLKDGKKLYLEWIDIAPRSQGRAALGQKLPFQAGTRFSFKLYQWRASSTGKATSQGRFGCADAQLAD